MAGLCILDPTEHIWWLELLTMNMCFTCKHMGSSSRKLGQTRHLYLVSLFHGHKTCMRVHHQPMVVAKCGQQNSQRNAAFINIAFDVFRLNTQAMLLTGHSADKKRSCTHGVFRVLPAAAREVSKLNSFSYRSPALPIFCWAAGSDGSAASVGLFPA